MENASALNAAQDSARCFSLTHTATTRYRAQQERFIAPLQSTWEGYPSALRLIATHVLGWTPALVSAGVTAAPRCPARNVRHAQPSGRDGIPIRPQCPAKDVEDT
jgi:hypothetical protein